MRSILPDTDVIFWRKANWEEISKGDVVFDFYDHDDVQYALVIAKHRKLIKFEDLSKGTTKWFTRMRFETKDYRFLE